jgi:hypothetical protein
MKIASRPIKKYMAYWILPGLLVWFAFSCFVTSGFAASPQSSLLIQPQDSKIARLYTAMLDRDIDNALPALDASGMLPASWPKDASGAEFNPLPMLFQKSSVLRAADLACAFANAYRMPQSKWRQKPEILEKIKTIVDAVIQYSSLDAPRERFAKSQDSTELTFLLEPMLTVFNLTANQLTDAELKKFSRWMQTTLDSLLERPLRLQNDEGMTWCAMMALATRATGNDKYLKAADDLIPWLLPLLGEAGEYLDPKGFSLERAQRFLRNLFLYRYYSGRENLDAKIIPSLIWYTRLHSSSGVPLLGVEDQPVQAYRTLSAQMLGPLAYYSRQEKSFAQTINRYMEKMMDAPPGFALERGGTAFLLASAYHQIPANLAPLPYEPYMQVCEQSPISQYLLVGRNYQTAVCLSDPACAKGMQVWSYKGEPPLLFPSPPRYTRMVGFGYDSHRINTMQEKQVFPYKIVSVTKNLDVLFVPTQDPISAYIFSQDLTAVIHKQRLEDSFLEWIQDSRLCAQPKQLQGTLLEFLESSAAFLLPIDTIPNYEVFDEGNRFRLHFKSEYCWYTLAGPNSKTIIRPIHSGLVFVHIIESEKSLNLVLNLSPNPFTFPDQFPGTKIPIPKMEAWSARIVNTP